MAGASMEPRPGHGPLGGALPGNPSDTRIPCWTLLISTGRIVFPAAAGVMGGDVRVLVERLYREHGSDLEARLFRITGNHADAIELTQETFARMLQIKDMDAIRDPRAYMFTIGVNLAVERVRQRRGRTTIDISDPLLEPELPHDACPEEQIDNAESIAEVRAVLAELPARCRAAFYLKHGWGMSYEEIARHLGVSKETVKKDLSRVILHCRRRLGSK